MIRKLKISILTLALTLLYANAAFALNWGPDGCYSRLSNQIFQVYGYSVTSTDTVCDEVEVYADLYRDDVRVEWNTDLRTEATWAQVDLHASNPSGIQAFSIFGEHRAKDGLLQIRTSTYSFRDW